MQITEEGWKGVALDNIKLMEGSNSGAGEARGEVLFAAHSPQNGQYSLDDVYIVEVTWEVERWRKGCFKMEGLSRWTIAAGAQSAVRCLDRN